MSDRIGGVVKHLPDDLPAYACIGTSLDLNERRDPVLVEE
jgi:hypothetical protein